MALEPDADPVTRARDLARTTEPERWIELSSSIRSRIRSLVPAGEPILVHEDAEASRTYVSSRVVVAALRALLQGAPTHAPAGIDLRIEDDRLVGVHLALVCAYGVPLRELGDRVRADAAAHLRQLLGTQVDLALVDVHVVDVVAGDPNLV